jgi:hypothetical protein
VASSAIRDYRFPPLPAELLDIIEQKGSEIQEALAMLRKL